jgi:hypothetical protein
MEAQHRAAERESEFPARNLLLDQVSGGPGRQNQLLGTGSIIGGDDHDRDFSLRHAVNRAKTPVAIFNPDPAAPHRLRHAAAGTSRPADRKSIQLEACLPAARLKRTDTRSAASVSPLIKRMGSGSGARVSNWLLRQGGAARQRGISHHIDRMPG